MRQTQRLGFPSMVGPSSFGSALLFSILVAGSAAAGECSSCAPESHNRTNWCGSVVFSADCLQEADSVKSIIALVRSDPKVTALGKRHCFNSIADNPVNQLSLVSSMHKVIALDAVARTVTVDAGITYTQLCPWLDDHGFALHNLASLTDISVAGAISTATHGSGVQHGNLATAVAALEMVTANGDVVRLSRGEVNFGGAVVGLGALGIIARITLDVQASYTMRQYVYLNLSLATVTQNFDSVMSSGYSVSLFTDWQNQQIRQVWIKVREGVGIPFAGPKTFWGAKQATQNVHPAGFSTENVTQQLGVPGPWYQRLPHSRPGTIASAGNELQTEYLVPRLHAVAAILAVERLRDLIGPHLFISEIRSVAADDLWMSTAYHRPTVGIHFTWKKDALAVQALLPLIELALSPFLPRPHWGKLFAVPPLLLRSRYAKLHAFRGLAAKHDPFGKFRNEFLNTNLFG